MGKKEDNASCHDMSLKEVFQKFTTSPAGLSDDEAEQRLEQFGPNEIVEKKLIDPLLIFLKQFNSFFVYVLILAAALSFFVGSFIDMYVVLVVILINAVIGFFQEYRAEKSIAALKRMVVSYAKVFREGELRKIPAKEIVPGDVIYLEEGDRIPADARVIEIKNLSTSEATLTGESTPVIKKISILKKETSLADCSNMLWTGTFVTTGIGKAVVTATREHTVFGSIVQDLESIKEPPSHFQKKTNMLALQMGLLALMGAFFTFLIGFFIRGFAFFDILIFTMASLVGGIPEGLPAVLAIVLGIGAFRMAKRNAIIRKVSATETLGVVDTIITDKTGTLTMNTLTVQKILLPNETEISVSGEGWSQMGEFRQKQAFFSPLENPQCAKLLHIAAHCNSAKILKEEGEEKYTVLGDPTEAALLVLAAKAGITPKTLEGSEKKIDDLPFHQLLKHRASTISLKKEKKKQLYVVGAPEALMKKSSHILKLQTVEKLTSQEKEMIEKQINVLTSKAMRVIALAYKELPASTTSHPEDEVEGLTYVGIVGMQDPPRPEVKGAILKARKAGIRVIMATGDHTNTARAIAREIGLITGEDKVLSEEDLLSLSESAFEDAVKTVHVFARLSPHMKLKIADALQKKGNIVAMTGDGVNDAPALKKADIGIAMGVIGTDVARESSEMVLADDNFASIIHAVEEGRVVFANTRQTSFFLITTNFATDLTIIATLLMHLPLPLLPTQILWLNLVTDTGPAIGLAAEPLQSHIIEEKPRNPRENILNREILPFLVLMTAVMFLLTVAVFFFFVEDITKARTAAFITMAFTQLFNAFNMRSLKKSLFSVGFLRNNYLNLLLLVSALFIPLVIYIPFFQNVFEFSSLTLVEFFILFALSSLVLWVGEGYKWMRNKNAL